MIPGRHDSSGNAQYFILSNSFAEWIENLLKMKEENVRLYTHNQFTAVVEMS